MKVKHYTNTTTLILLAVLLTHEIQWHYYNLKCGARTHMNDTHVTNTVRSDAKLFKTYYTIEFPS